MRIDRIHKQLLLVIFSSLAQKSIQKSFRAILLIILAFVITVILPSHMMGQVTTNSGSGLAPSYPDLATAITALNAATITDPVVITLTGNETAPAGGYSITQVGGTSTNTITIEGDASTITAFTPQSSGSSSANMDALFKIIGGDWITIQDFTMQENGGNTNMTPGTTNTMTEFGVLLVHSSATEGAQNNTIQNNIISLNSAYTNSIGIFSTSASSPTNGILDATSTAGTNSYNKIYGNSISNVAYGIGFICPPITSTAFETGNDIGGTSAMTGNTITFGNATASSGPWNRSQSTVQSGIFIRNGAGNMIRYNSITSNNLTYVGTGGLNGVLINSGTAPTSVTYTSTVSDNTIVLMTTGVTVINGIEYGHGISTGAIVGSNNNITITQNAAAAVSAAITGIKADYTSSTNTLTGNTITTNQDQSVGATTSAVRGINASGVGTTVTVNSNIITIKQNAATGTGSYGTAAVTYIDVAAASANVNANFNQLLTTSNTIRNAGTITGINAGTAPVTCTFNQNNINLSAAAVSPTINGITAGPTGSVKIYSDTLSFNASAGSGSGPTITAINVSAGTNDSVYYNVIRNIMTGAGTVIATITGISISGGTTPYIFKNKIHDIGTSNILGANIVSGIRISAGTTSVNISNNYIGNLTASATSSTDAIRGINLTSATVSSTINVFYNTIFLNASSTGTNFGTTAIYHTFTASSTTAILNLRNNLIINKSTARGSGFTVALRRNSTVLTNYSSTSNNNLFYAGNPVIPNCIYYDGTPRQMAAFQIFVGPTRESASFTESISSVPGVFFQSFTGSDANYLHIVAGITTQIESGAVNISGYTNDYDGNTRQGNSGYSGTGTAPDMGADEFEGIPGDFTSPLINYTVLPSTLCTDNPSLSATITDLHGVNTSPGTKPRIWFRKTSNPDVLPATNDNTTNGWKFTEATNSSSPFNFTIDYSIIYGGVLPGDMIRYFIVAQDNATVPNLAINSGMFNIVPPTVALNTSAFPLSGTVNLYSLITPIPTSVTIGMGGTYTSLTGTNGLFNNLNNTGLSGNTIVKIISAAITEDGTFPLNAINYACNTPYTLTIKPEASVNVVLSGSSANAIIDLNGADNVIIDGLNSGGSSLTIRNTNISGATVRFTADATNNIIENAIIEGGVTTGTLGVVTIGTGTTTGNDNNAILNNTIRDWSDGAGVPANLVYSSGLSSTVTNSNINVSGNTLKNFTANGITLPLSGSSNVNDNWSISNNLIFQESARTTGMSGISFSSSGINSITSNIIRDLNTSNTVTGILLFDARNTNVSRNKIYNIPSTSGSTSSLTGIQFQGASGTAASVTLENNMICLAPSFTNNQIVRGIYDFSFNTNTLKLYYNSIYIGGTSGGTNASWAIVRGVSSPNSFIATNNIAFNDRTGGGANHFAAGDQSAMTGTFTSNYNIFVGTGIVAGNFMDYGILTTGTPVPPAIWQAGPPTRDANSQFSNPGGLYTLSNMFLSSIDLHAATENNPASNAGINIPGSTTDYDNDVRDGLTPDIGLDEFSPCSLVLNTNDSGFGSLRDIIGCALDGTTISFAPTLMNQTITLTSGEIGISKNLTISGLGMANLTISGNNNSRIFHTTPGNLLALNNMSLKNANALSPNGGAIFIESSLNLENILFDNNFEDGIIPKAISIISTGQVQFLGNVIINE